MTVSLAGALKGKGITVNTVSPGVIITAGMLAWGRSLAKTLGWGDPSPEELERRIATERLRAPRGADRTGGGHRDDGLPARQPPFGLHHRREPPHRRRTGALVN